MALWIGPGAEGSAGGVIVANTKSGSNSVKGSLFEYFRNEALDAPNFFSPVADGEKHKPSLRYNVFGGTVGGPIPAHSVSRLNTCSATRASDTSALRA